MSLSGIRSTVSSLAYRVPIIGRKEGSCQEGLAATDIDLLALHP